MFKNHQRKRKKSGAENKRASKARKEENERLESFMVNYFATSSESSTKNDDASINDEGPGDTATRDKEVEDKGAQDAGKNPNTDNPYDANKVNVVEDEVEGVLVAGGDPSQTTTDSAYDQDRVIAHLLRILHSEQECTSTRGQRSQLPKDVYCLLREKRRLVMQDQGRI